MQFSIVVTGKPGGCKSTTIAKFLYEFTKMGLPSGHMPEYVSDRILLEQKVLVDVHWHEPKHYRFRSEDGALLGDHSVLFDGNKPPGQRQFEVTDGLFLNEVHNAMVERMLFHQNPNGEIFEYATGPDKVMGLSTLDQSGDALVARFARLLQERTKINKVLLFEVDAGLEERTRRNGNRPDGMKEHTFRTFFGDGGELKYSGSAKLTPLGIDYIYIDNDHDNINRFLVDIELYTDTLIRPLAEGFAGRGENGWPASTRDRSRR